VYKLTPLHLAVLSGDDKSTEYLVSLGADSNALDSSLRKPSNLSFSSFIDNTQKFAKIRGSTCQMPEIFIDPENPIAALSEIHRLVDEGEPLVVRNLVQFLNRTELLHWNTTRFVQKVIKYLRMNKWLKFASLAILT
jgi:hypothetical protein